MDEHFIVSAPGKVILHGEHAVVYGKTALAASLNLRTYLHMRKRKDNQINVHLPNIDKSVSWSTDDIKKYITPRNTDPMNPVEASKELLSEIRALTGITSEVIDTKELSLVVFLYLYSSIAVADTSSIPGIDIKVISRQPVSAGLGSSAAYSVCLASSLLQLRGAIPMESCDWSERDRDLINKWAFFGEKILHGKPSGIDNSISTFGGAIRFQSGKMTSLKSFPKLNILLVNTGVPRSTMALVTKCREKLSKYPDIIQPVLDSIEAISQRCEVLFSKMVEQSSNDFYEELEDMIDINQHHLNVLGVGHSELDKIVRMASLRKLHSKLTGAGGGGCAFILIKPDTSTTEISELKSEFEAENYSCWETTIGSQGVATHGLNEKSGIAQELFLLSPLI